MRRYAERKAFPPCYEPHVIAKKALRPILGPAPGSPQYRGRRQRRTVPVRQMRSKGQKVLWAGEPPVPIKDQPQEKPKGKPRTMKAP